MEDKNQEGTERLVVDIAAGLKRNIDIQAATQNVSMRSLVEPILKKAFGNKIQK